MTEEGAQAWHVLTSSPVQVGPSGRVLGIDMVAALGLADAFSYDLGAIAELLPFGSDGLAAGIRDQTPEFSDQGN